jgi:hypothetical protein
VGTPDEPTAGAYGLAVNGLPSPDRLLRLWPADWLDWRVSWQASTPPAEPDRFADGVTSLSLGGGWGRVRIERAGRRTLVTSPTKPSSEAFVHPVLSVSALMAARWDGAEPFHGGVFVHRGQAWVALGAREAGKSTTLGAMHRLGIDVASDDLAVVKPGREGHRVMTGPRCLDLREGAARTLAMGEFIGFVGNRDRWRVDLPMLAPEHPLGGFLLLEWGRRMSLQLMPAAERLALLAGAYAAVGLTSTDPIRTLDLAALPVLRWTRPRNLADMEHGVATLLAGLSSRAGTPS